MRLRTGWHAEQNRSPSGRQTAATQRRPPQPARQMRTYPHALAACRLGGQPRLRLRLHLCCGARWRRLLLCCLLLVFLLLKILTHVCM